MSKTKNSKDSLVLLDEIPTRHWIQSALDFNEYHYYKCKSTGLRILTISKQNLEPNSSKQASQLLVSQRFKSFEQSIAQYNDKNDVDDASGSNVSTIVPALENNTNTWMAFLFEHGLMSLLLPTSSTIHLSHFLEHVYVSRAKDLLSMNDIGAATLFEITRYDLCMARKDINLISKYLKLLFGPATGAISETEQILHGGIGGSWPHGMKIQHLEVKYEFYGKMDNNWMEFEMILQHAAVPNHPVFGFNGFPIKTDYQTAIADHQNTLVGFFENGYRQKNAVIVLCSPHTTTQLKAQIEKALSVLESPKNKIKQTEDTKKVAARNETVQKTMNKIPFIPEYFHTFFIMKSINHSSGIVIRCVIEPFYARHLYTAPLRYVLAVLDCRLEGSLYYTLMSNGYIVDFNVRSTNCSFVSVVALTVNLTSHGFKNWIEALKTIFEYMKWLQQEPPSQEFYQQLMELQKVYFHHLIDRNDRKYGTHLAQWLSCSKNPVQKLTHPEMWAEKYKDQPVDDILYPVNCMQGYNANLIKELQQLLSVEECSVTLFYENRFKTCTLLSKMQESKTPLHIENYPCTYVPVNWTVLEKTLKSVKKDMSVKKTFKIPTIPEKIMSQLTRMDCPVTDDPANHWYGTQHAANEVDKTISESSITVTTTKNTDCCHKIGTTPNASYSMTMVCDKTTLKWIGTRNGKEFFSLWSKLLLQELQQKYVHPFNATDDGFILPDAYEGCSIPEFAVAITVSVQGDFGICIELEGAPINLHTLACQIMTSVFHPVEYLSEVAFGATKDKFLFSKHLAIMQTEKYADLLADYILEPNTYLYDPMRPYDGTSFELFHTMLLQFIVGCIIQISLEGCITISQKAQITKCLSKLQKGKMGGKVSLGRIKRNRRIPENRKFLVLVSARNPNLSNSVMINHYEFDIKDIYAVKQAQIKLESAIDSLNKKQFVGYTFTIQVIEPEETPDRCYIRTMYLVAPLIKRENNLGVPVFQIDQTEEKALSNCGLLFTKGSTKNKKGLPKMIGKLSIRVFSTVPEFKVYESRLFDEQTGITYLNVPLTDEAVIAKPGELWVINKSYEIVNNIDATIKNWQ